MIFVAIRNRRKWIVMPMRFFLIACLCFTFICGGCGKQSAANNGDDYQTIRLVMTCNGTKDGMDTRICEKISREVSDETGGKVQIVVFPNEQLSGGDTRKGIEMFTDGSVDLAAYAAGTLSIIDEHLAVGSVPWAFSGYKEARRVIDGTGGQYYQKILDGRGITYLGSAHNGMRQLSNNKHPVRTLADMDGLRIRVPGGGVHESFIRAVGGTPILLSWSEISSAISNGVVDGQENGFLGTKSANLQNIQQYMTVWNYSYENYIFMANSQVFQALEPNVQELIRRKTREACEWGRDFMEENDEKIKEEFRHNGVEITELNEEEIRPFREQTEPLVAELKKKYGEEACDAFQIP